MDTRAPRAAPPTQPAVNLAPVVTGAILVLAAVHIARVYVLTDRQDLVVLSVFGFAPIRGWSDPLTALTLVSHSLLHTGAAHLIVNSIWLAIFGSPLASRLGTARFLAFWGLTAAAGALAMALLVPGFDGIMIGASGAISGMTGAAARYGFRVDRRSYPATYVGAPLPFVEVIRVPLVYSFVGIWLATNLLAGTGLLTGGGTAIAWQAHLGGFLAGFLLIGPFVPGSRTIAS